VVFSLKHSVYKYLVHAGSGAFQIFDLSQLSHLSVSQQATVHVMFLYDVVRQ